MEKIVVVINGKGGSGKDTCCDIVSKYYRVKNISSIDCIKDILKICGWGGVKDNKSRKLMSDLKKLLSEYNDYPTNSIVEGYKEFLKSDEEVLFVHIREGSEINKFKENLDTDVITLLIKRDGIGDLGNTSDDEVENYSYDYVFENNCSLSELENVFKEFFNSIISGI